MSLCGLRDVLGKASLGCVPLTAQMQAWQDKPQPQRVPASDIMEDNIPFVLQDRLSPYSVADTRDDERPLHAAAQVSYRTAKNNKRK